MLIILTDLPEKFVRSGIKVLLRKFKNKIRTFLNLKFSKNRTLDVTKIFLIAAKKCNRLEMNILEEFISEMFPHMITDVKTSIN